MKAGIMSKEELIKYIKFSGCETHCRGSQHVGMSCRYVVGELIDLDISVRCGAFRSMIQNKQAVMDSIYEIYIKC